MRTFLKQLILFLVLSGMLLIMVGCGGGGGGGGNGGGLDEAAIKLDIEKRIKSFKAAVEAYDVKGMLGFLEESAADPLTIVEGENKYSKSYETLETELKGDEHNQLYWRKPPSEGGNGYTLLMEVLEIAYGSITASGAFATVFFIIIEAAEDPEIPGQVTDQGDMVCEMVKAGGTWYCRKMTIHFEPVEAGASSAGSSAPSILYQVASKGVSSTGRTGGFGFGRFDFE